MVVLTTEITGRRFKIITNCNYLVHAWIVQCMSGDYWKCWFAYPDGSIYGFEQASNYYLFSYCIYIYLRQPHIDFFNISSICTTAVVSFAVYNSSASTATFEQVIIFQLCPALQALTNYVRAYITYSKS